MSMLFALTIVATAAGLSHVLLRVLPARLAATTRAARPMRVTDPRRQNPSGHRLWQLQPQGCRCAHARRLGGRRLDVEDTEPLAHTGSVGCRCTYRPIADARRATRRRDADRRAELRFDLVRSDRRLHTERRRFREAWGRDHAHR